MDTFPESGPQPPVWDSALGLWWVSSYPDGRNILDDNQAVSNQATLLPPRSIWPTSAEGQGMVSLLSSSPLAANLDGAEHRLARESIENALPRRKQLDQTAQSSLQQVLDIDELGEAIRTGGTIDLAEVAKRYVFKWNAATAGILDVPEDFYVDTGETSAPTWWLDKTPEDEQKSAVTLGQLFTFCAQSDQAWRQASDETLAGADNYIANAIKQARAAGRSEEATLYEEIMTGAMTIMTAGTDTTSLLITKALETLMQGQDAWHDLHQTSDETRRNIVAGLVNETLVNRTSVHGWVKQAKENMIVGGQEIAAEDLFLVLLGACNRDAARGNQPELTFGLGAHRCIGRYAARAIATEGIYGLTSQIANATLLESKAYTDLVFNGYKSLRTHVTPAE